MLTGEIAGFLGKAISDNWVAENITQRIRGSADSIGGESRLSVQNGLSTSTTVDRNGRQSTCGGFD